ncbi:hypothetical protein [Saccharomonospora sp. CUA-673]|uniref:hypothetical protein n=1 Tax=Saccharomonospora sp. CUA-673 TaxID=1904969 RepID=UPI001C9E89B9|nr:hypothetical protein [Saccharomonospora sp. CUA-673]
MDIVTESTAGNGNQWDRVVELVREVLVGELLGCYAHGSAVRGVCDRPVTSTSSSWRSDR